MSATDQSTARPMRTRPTRARTLGDELLEDLRRAAPMPAAQPSPEVPVPVTSVTQPRAEADAPTIDLRITPRLWWGLRLKTLGEGPGVVIGAGPVRISLSGFRR